MGQVGGGVAFRFKCKNTDVEQTLLVINLNNYSIWFRFSCFIAKRVHVLINIKKGKIFTLLLLLNLLFTNAFQWNKKYIVDCLRSETKILLWESSEGLHSSLVCKKEHLKHKNWSVGTAETEREKIVLFDSLIWDPKWLGFWPLQIRWKRVLKEKMPDGFTQIEKVCFSRSCWSTYFIVIVVKNTEIENRWWWLAWWKNFNSNERTISQLFGK